ncbi:MAG: HAD-IC family P-type ATPase [Legionellaceae bacterium]|nr:HAD-IC family P-type ATPase [Legionellaceae bacterium]
MAVKIIFEYPFLISGIMCHGGCGYLIQDAISEYVSKKYPNAKLTLYSEPQVLSMHLIKVVLEQEEYIPVDIVYEDIIKDLTLEIINADPDRFRVIDLNTLNKEKEFNYVNLVNILVNVIAIISIIVLSIIFPPSLLLSLGLAGISFITTAFTAREYLINFFKSLRSKNIFNMDTTIAFGWILSLAHTVYHLQHMPLVTSFSMTFMNFLMPLILVAIVNLMAEIKRLVMKKSEKVSLNGLSSLFPQMSETYQVQDESGCKSDASRMSLKEGMRIWIPKGECFPVDGVLLDNTFVDSSIMNGEAVSRKDKGMLVQAGYINLGDDVLIKSTTDSYNSQINKMLFEANAEVTSTKKPNKIFENRFYYFYFGLIAVGFVLSLILSLSLGMFSVAMMLQMTTGILFAVCPCTIAIAHYFPRLLGAFSLNKNDILIRNTENVSSRLDDIDIVVFDKTGTLTVGNGEVVDDAGLSEDTWQAIYTLEKKLGFNHPIARAIQCHYETKYHPLESSLVVSDTDESSHNGLSALIGDSNLSIGNADYFKSKGIQIPELPVVSGQTPVYVAENSKYKGRILIKHAVRPGIIKSLQKLKDKQIRIIMLTGDSQSSATGFNQENGNIFADDSSTERNIQAEKTPSAKKEYLKNLMTTIDPNLGRKPKVWFIGDGLNDAPCSNTVSKEGGISCAITSNEKASFFTDISLNGTLDYLFEYKKINKSIDGKVRQNQWILACGAVIFLVFLIGFPLLGIGMSPLIPMVIMMSTTLFTLFNSYRSQIETDNSLNRKVPMINKILGSNLSTGLLIGGSILLVIAILVASLSSLHLALPAFVFTAGLATSISGGFLIAASIMLGSFAVMSCSYLWMNSPAFGCISSTVEEEVTSADEDATPSLCFI